MILFSRYSLWFAAMAGLLVLLAVAGQTPALNPFQHAFLRATGPVEDALSGIFRPLAETLSGGAGGDALRAENRELRIEIERLRNDLAEAQGNAARVEELERALGVTTAEGAGRHVAANVTTRDSSAFSDVIAIDRGSDAGIKTGMVVISSGGTLVGRVTKTFSDRAFVRLITDSKSRVTATTAEGADGVVEGTAARGLVFSLVQSAVAEGDLVVTSGLGGNYPPNLPVGRVVAVSGTGQDAFREVALEPNVRLSTIRTVLVITSFLPQSAPVGDPE